MPVTLPAVRPAAPSCRHSKRALLPHRGRWCATAGSRGPSRCGRSWHLYPRLTTYPAARAAGRRGSLSSRCGTTLKQWAGLHLLLPLLLLMLPATLQADCTVLLVVTSREVYGLLLPKRMLGGASIE